MKKYLVIAVIIMAIVQLCAPTYMMINRFETLNKGTQYKFKVEPVDPHDAFRGRYLSIRASTENINKLSYKNNSKVYAIISVDQEGFANVESVESKKPSEGKEYINAKIKYGRLILPFDRYYMEESLAPDAETAYNAQRKDAYITVRVKGGNSVIEGLYIDNIKIEDYVKNLR